MKINKDKILTFLNEKVIVDVKDKFINLREKSLKFIIKNKTIIIQTSILVVLTIIIAIVTRKPMDRINVKEDKIFKGTTFVTETFPIFKDVVFVGDSYAHYIPIEFGYDTIVYSSPGLSVSELSYCFSAAEHNQRKYLVVFLGPNDFRYSVKPKDFKRTLTEHLKPFIGKSKIILCTYLPSIFTDEVLKLKKAKFEIEEYDDELKSIASSNKNIYYFDIKDMARKAKFYRYDGDNLDKIHFNHTFYIEYITRLNDFILSIK